MTFPAIVFSFFLAAFFGSLLHLWRGGSLGQLLLYLIFSWVGFFGGHFIAELLDIRFIDVGTIHLGFAMLGSVAFLGLGYWLSLINPQK